MFWSNSTSNLLDCSGAIHKSRLRPAHPICSVGKQDAVGDGRLHASVAAWQTHPNHIETMVSVKLDEMYA